MTEEQPRIRIQENAKLAIEQLGPLSGLGERFGYNLESVEWVEGYIERMRKHPDFGPDPKPVLISVLGSYLGECVIRIYGGQWRLNEELGWGVWLSDGNMVFPFNKVQKLFKNGLEGGDSILSFVRIIGHFQKEGWPSGKKT
jgi:hypothetical protein